MKIMNENNMVKTLQKVEKDTSVRQFDTDRIDGIVEASEKRLKVMGIKKEHWEGCRIKISPPRLAMSYSYRGEGTQVQLIRKASGWSFLEARRISCGRCSRGGAGHVDLILSDKALANVDRFHRLREV